MNGDVVAGIIICGNRGLVLKDKQGNLFLPKFDMPEKSRELDEIRPGGLGVYLIKSVMDFTEWSFDEKSGNKLYMYKILPRGNK